MYELEETLAFLSTQTQIYLVVECECCFLCGNNRRKEKADGTMCTTRLVKTFRAITAWKIRARVA